MGDGNGAVIGRLRMRSKKMLLSIEHLERNGLQCVVLSFENSHTWALSACIRSSHEKHAPRISLQPSVPSSFQTSSILDSLLLLRQGTVSCEDRTLMSELQIHRLPTKRPMNDGNRPIFRTFQPLQSWGGCHEVFPLTSLHW